MFDHQNQCEFKVLHELPKKKWGSRQKSRPLPPRGCELAFYSGWNCWRARRLNVARAIMLNDLHTRFPQTKEEIYVMVCGSSQHNSRVLKHRPSRSFPSFSLLFVWYHHKNYWTMMEKQIIIGHQFGLSPEIFISFCFCLFVFSLNLGIISAHHTAVNRHSDRDKTPPT